MSEVQPSPRADDNAPDPLAKSHRPLIGSDDTITPVHSLVTILVEKAANARDLQEMEYFLRERERALLLDDALRRQNHMREIEREEFRAIEKDAAHSRSMCVAALISGTGICIAGVTGVIIDGNIAYTAISYIGLIFAGTGLANISPDYIKRHFPKLRLPEMPWEKPKGSNHD